MEVNSSDKVLEAIYQLWYVIHFYVHFQAHDLKLDPALPTRYFLAFLWRLHKFEHYIEHQTEETMI